MPVEALLFSSTASDPVPGNGEGNSYFEVVLDTSGPGSSFFIVELDTTDPP